MPVASAREASGASDAPPTGAEAEIYERHKDDLACVLREEGRAIFEDKPFPFVSGLLNQGATCYMNSLLQVSNAT